MSSRRRLRVITSSSSEDEDDVIQLVPPQPQQSPDNNNNNLEPETLNLQSVTLNPSTNTHSIPIDISDEEFIDAFEDLETSPPVQPPPGPTIFTSSEHSRTSSFVTSEATSSSDSPVSKFLEELGLRLKGEWLDACVNSLERGVPGFGSLDSAKKAKMCFERFLECDLNYCGLGVLPRDVSRMHLVDLPGPFVLQVDEIVNIGQPLRERYKKANPGLKRCLKLSMTDGVQRVFGMEYQPIKDLDALAPAGLKVAISNVHVRHGLLMLVPEVFQVLGGMVEDLDAARQRLVTEVNKPPRGKRTRSGVVPPLATRATRAAWPTEDIPVSRPSNNPAPQRETSIQVDDQGSRAARSIDDIHISRPSNNPVPQRETPIQVDEQGTRAGRRNDNIHVSRPSNNSVLQRATPIPVADQGTHAAWSIDDIHVSRPSNNPVSQRATPMQADDQGTTPATVNGRVFSNFATPVDREHVAHHPSRTEVESSFSTRRENTEPLHSMALTENSFNMHMESASFTVPNPLESVNMTPLRVTDKATVPIQRASPVAISDDEDAHMATAEEKHSAVGRSNETPFTYLSSLSVKWAESKENAAHVEGKIKCFVTGVKGFAFKQRSTYQLQVFVDDGSLISEILIDHNFVQKKIGYSPEEANTALSSSDASRVQDMKNIMKQFQVFLANFEGTMVLRINEASSLPVAIDMQQGCPVSDAWLLLTRLNSSNPDQHPQLDPIDLSP